jgi:hypothetical protein
MFAQFCCQDQGTGILLWRKEHAMAFQHTERVKDAIQSHLTSGTVGDVIVVPGFDSDDEPIVEVRVSIVSDFSKLQGLELVKLTGFVRQAMREVEDSRFPIISVMNKRDWDELNSKAFANEGS